MDAHMLAATQKYDLIEQVEYTQEQFRQIMRPYQIARKMKCKFYMGSDSHHPKGFENMKKNFEITADYLE